MIKKKYSKFQNKVLKISLYIGIIPLLIVSVVSLSTVLKTRLKDIAEFQMQVMNGANEKIKAYLDQKMSVFNLVIDLTPNDISELDVSQLDFVAQGLKEAAGDVRELSFIDKNGQEVIKKSEIHSPSVIFLENLKDEKSFQTAITGKNYLGPVYYTLNGPVAQIASQIENKNRQIIGVILAEVSLKPIENEIAKIKIGKEGFVYLVDKEGNLIAASNQNFARQGENLSYIPLIRDITKGETHTGLLAEERYKNSLGQKVIFAGRPQEITGWSIIAEWPISDAFNVAVSLIGRFLLVLAFSLILIVAASLFFVQLVVKPVQDLSRGADEISKGNFDYKIAIKTGDELEKLGERFNKMIEVLRENQRLRDEFVFIAAHELRAPVTVIRGYISMLMEGDAGPLSAKMKEFLSPVMQSGNGLNKLVEDLLQVARSEAGRIEIKVQPVDIKEQVQEVLKELKVLSDAKSIELVYEPPANFPKILADADKFKEVVKNLVDNGIKYTLGAGAITVWHEIKGQMLVTHIKDTGLGISAKHQENLFQKFYRVKTDKTQEIQGTGLGLWIIKQLLEKMNGAIWCQSEEGKGSTFSFSLPLA